MDVDSQSRYERAKPKFKAKMNGLKLSQKIDKSQVEAILWAFDNEPALLEMLYVKKKPFNRKGFDQFKARWPGPRNYGWKDAEKAWAALNPNDELVERILSKLDEEAEWRETRHRLGLSTPNWKSPASWIRHERWEAEFTLTAEEKQSERKSTYVDKTTPILNEIRNLKPVHGGQFLKEAREFLKGS